MVDAIDELGRGRESYARRAWMDAYRSLSQADQAAPLGAEDLDLLATSAFMLGRDDDCLSSLERAHHAYLDAGEAMRAVRCAFWLVINLALGGEMSRATGWLGRAQRLVERDGGDCVERGYLLVPIMLRHEAAGDWEAAYAAAADAAEIGERFGDADLLALAIHEQGLALIQQERVEEGLGLLDEAMVAVTAGELSPIVTGIVYCSVIMGCQEVYALRRAQEWTAALTRWCEEQPEMVAFSGRCLVHRAEIMELHGAWREALEEAQRAHQRCLQGKNQSAAAQAFYRQAEVHRLQGLFSAAEEAYRDASRCGCEPQPGLALLRLAQGNNDAAAAAIRRAVGETTEPLKRARLLPAYVEIMLAVGDVQEARSACRELEEISARYESGMLSAMSAHAEGAVDLAEGDTRAALLPLRHAWQMWQELEVPYEAARVRVLLGLACRTLGDDDTAALELEAARDVFEQLGAAPDLARADSLTRRAASVDARGLTPRELQVLRLLAAGRTNKAIAAELVLSERTVDRHVSNIFTKLGVSSRSAATAYAYKQQLV
ncbi:MAG TPA: LuxR C-terminal-related transcriptional regulator [Gemmatimonadales bacterium]|nr:LuxR C-terminal-related transcriptional regulator [Gemmatimonadales bacterium]